MPDELLAGTVSSKDAAKFKRLDAFFLLNYAKHKDAVYRLLAGTTLEQRVAAAKSLPYDQDAGRVHSGNGKHNLTSYQRWHEVELALYLLLVREKGAFIKRAEDFDKQAEKIRELDYAIFWASETQYRPYVDTVTPFARDVPQEVMDIFDADIKAMKSNVQNVEYDEFWANCSMKNEWAKRNGFEVEELVGGAHLVDQTNIHYYRSKYRNTDCYFFTWDEKIYVYTKR